MKLFLSKEESLTALGSGALYSESSGSLNLCSSSRGDAAESPPTPMLSRSKAMGCLSEKSMKNTLITITSPSPALHCRGCNNKFNVRFVVQRPPTHGNITPIIIA